jgi:hypothetical protein
MASEIVSGRVELLRRGSQYVARSSFSILNSSHSASSICEDFRDPLATLLTKEGLTFNLLAILAYRQRNQIRCSQAYARPARDSQRSAIFPGGRLLLLLMQTLEAEPSLPLCWPERLYEVFRACCSSETATIYYLVSSTKINFQGKI